MTLVEFTVNGKKCIVKSDTSRDTSLSSYIRYELQLPGTKCMCQEGGCGACIVVVGREGNVLSVNSCLVLVYSCNGWDITTVEGIGNRVKSYHPIMKRLASFNGSQCGYCSPGWVMQMYSLFEKKMKMADIEKSFASNTCRCTGYRPILDTMKSFAVDASQSLLNTVTDIEDLSIESKCPRKCSNRNDDSDWYIIEKQCDIKAKPLVYYFEEGQKFFKVHEVHEIFTILNEVGYDSYMLVAGNTGKGLLESFEYPKILIDINNVNSLQEHHFSQNLTIGANMTLEGTKQLFEDTASTRDDFDYLAEFAKHFELIAHIPVRNIGTLAGNLMMKQKLPTYPSDIFILFESVGAVLTLEMADGTEQTLTMTEFLKTDIRRMIIISIELPPLSMSYVVRTYKIMARHQNALAIVNSSFVIKFNKDTNIIEHVSIVYGNISPEFIHAVHTEKYLVGKKFNNTVLQEALNILSNEIQPVYEPTEESTECRKKIALGIFYKFILGINPTGSPSPKFISGGSQIQRPLSRGQQDFQSDQGLYPLNQAMPKLEALIQVSGEAQFCNDLPNFPRQVFAAFVLSTIHSGELDCVDSAEVLDIAGVVTVLTAKDIPGINTFTHPGLPLEDHNEELLVSKHIKFYGQPVAIVVAESEALAVEVANKVNVIYKTTSDVPPVLIINEAKKYSDRLAVGEPSIKPKSKGEDVKRIIKGIYEIEAQYHYYMEPMTSVVIPVDDGLEVYSATQWLDLTQIAIADCLKMKESDVHVILRRIGGGFGGKLSRSSQVSTACALVAKTLNVPCRFILPMKTNLTIAGKRLPCQTEYEIGVDENGKIQYLEASLIEDDGCSHNENILEYTIGGFKSCYNTDTWNVKTATVLTDLPSNTFARAPGTFEGIATIEHIMEHIAFEIQKDPSEVRIANMRTDDNDLPELITMFQKEVDFHNRQEEIKKFNASNRWMKKAITTSSMLFPVEFYKNYHAMITIYRDGTVTVTTGGIEMGQGVNTKAAQVCAYTLEIPLNYVTVIPNYSFTAANDVFSGSSIVSESVCFSIIKACGILQERLKPFKEKCTNCSWKDIVVKALDDQVDLVATYMMTDKEPELNNYNAYAVTVLEVQLDVLLGKFEILRVDILEDVGLSANPSIDVGQVEGGYVQGLGYFTSEKFKYDEKTGKLLTNRSLNYHVPLAMDIPADFRVKLRYNSKNPKGVLGSKAVGEMGICTSHSITHNLRRCIQESRKDSGYDTTQWINIDIPYTTESILKALGVKLSEFVIMDKAKLAKAE